MKKKQKSRVESDADEGTRRLHFPCHRLVGASRLSVTQPGRKDSRTSWEVGAWCPPWLCRYHQPDARRTRPHGVI